MLLLRVLVVENRAGAVRCDCPDPRGAGSYTGPFLLLSKSACVIVRAGLFFWEERWLTTDVPQVCGGSSGGEIGGSLDQAGYAALLHV